MLWRRKGPRSEGDGDATTAAAPASAVTSAEALSQPEFAVLTVLAAVPGGADLAMCARSLRLPLNDVSLLIEELRARDLVEVGLGGVVAVTSDGRRALHVAQVPCCVKIPGY